MNNPIERINVDSTRMLLARKLELERKAGRESIIKKLIESKGLNKRDLRNFQRRVAASYLGLKANASRTTIENHYFESISWQLSILRDESAKREFIVNELKRLQLAELLLLDKISASPQNIMNRLQEMDVDLRQAKLSPEELNAEKRNGGPAPITLDELRQLLAVEG